MIISEVTLPAAWTCRTTIPFLNLFPLASLTYLPIPVCVKSWRESYLSLFTHETNACLVTRIIRSQMNYDDDDVRSVKVTSIDLALQAHKHTHTHTSRSSLLSLLQYYSFLRGILWYFHPSFLSKVDNEPACLPACHSLWPIPSQQHSHDTGNKPQQQHLTCQCLFPLAVWRLQNSPNFLANIILHCLLALRGIPGPGC